MKKIKLLDTHPEGSCNKISKTAVELEEGTKDWILCLGDDELKKEYESSFKENKIQTICECYEEHQGFEIISKGYKNLKQFLEDNLESEN